MLANYDRTSDWGLAIYQEDREIGKYPDFPTALRAFLIQQGYLDKNGKPKMTYSKDQDFLRALMQTLYPLLPRVN